MRSAKSPMASSASSNARPRGGPRARALLRSRRPSGSPIEAVDQRSRAAAERPRSPDRTACRCARRARAAAGAARRGDLDDSASYTSRDVSGISSPLTPSGLPRPSQRSKLSTQASAVRRRPGRAALRESGGHSAAAASDVLDAPRRRRRERDTDAQRCRGGPAPRCAGPTRPHDVGRPVCRL